MSVKEKENALNYVLRAVSVFGFDSMDVQDVLLKHNWNKDAAVEDLKSRPPKPVKRTFYQTTSTHQNENQQNGTQNGNRVKKPRRESEDVVDSDGGEYNKSSNVFDSDDSENEGYTPEMNIQRKEVYDFFNNANVGELTSIKSCSLKKAEIIIENRPYRNWEELVSKFQEKPLQTDLLNNCQEYLDKRNSLKKLMKKCKAIVLKLERAVADGAGINEQPFTLNEGLQLSNYQLVSDRISFRAFVNMNFLQVGLNWLAVLHQNGTNGILADEVSKNYCVTRAFTVIFVVSF